MSETQEVQQAHRALKASGRLRMTGIDQALIINDHYDLPSVSLRKSVVPMLVNHILDELYQLYEC